MSVEQALKKIVNMKFQEYVPNAYKIAEAGNNASDHDNQFAQDEEDKLYLNA